MKKLISLIIVLFLTAPVFSVFAQDARAPLRNSDVINLLKAKLPESTVIMTIQTRPSAFDMSTDALVNLKERGVPTKVIEAMLQASVKPAAAASAAPRTSQDSTSASAATSTPAGGAGLAYFWGSKQTRIEVDRVFLVEGDKRTEMKFTKPATRTRFVFAIQQFAVLGGTKARLRSDNRSPEFEMILPNNVEVSSIVALGLLAERSNGTREILIGGGFMSISQGLPSERNMHLTYEKLPDQSGAPEGYEIYRIRPTDQIKPGEYAFMVSKPSGGNMGGLAGAGFSYNFYELGVD